MTGLKILSTNLETELFHYHIVAAADVVNGRVVDFDVFVHAKEKRRVE